MLEQPLQPKTEEDHKGHARRLHGLRLWLARAAFFLLFALVLVFFITGLPTYIDTLGRGDIGMLVKPGTEGALIVTYVFPPGDAAGAGVRVGDVLVAINGIANPTLAQANALLAGKMGDPVSITVRTGSQPARSYALAYATKLSLLLANVHLSVRFMLDYNIVLSILLGSGILLTSLMVFFRRSDDWLGILVAFAMLAFGSYLTTPVGVGAYKLHVAFMNSLIYMAGMVSMIVVFFLFPTGHFVPRWTRWVAILLFIPALADFINLQAIHNSLLDFILWIGFLGLGAFAQVYRYLRAATPVERQQTKRVVFGAVACFSIIALLDLAAFLIGPYLNYLQYFLFYYLIAKAGGTLPILLLDVSFVLAIYRYRLWDTDLYINRTLVYTLVTGMLMVVWVVTTQLLNYLSEQFFGKQVSWLGALLSTLQVAVIYKPVRNWVEEWINKRFYKDRIDYSKALVELKPEMWNFLSPADLVHTLVTTVPELLQSGSAALFLCERQGLTLLEVQNLHPSEANKFPFTEEILKKLELAEVVSLPAASPFGLLVPLTVSRLKVFDLVGVLAVGPRHGGRGYSRDHRNDLSALGRSAGTALYMLQLNDRKRGPVLPTRAEG